MTTSNQSQRGSNSNKQDNQGSASQSSKQSHVGKSNQEDGTAWESEEDEGDFPLRKEKRKEQEPDIQAHSKNSGNQSKQENKTQQPDKK